MNTIVEVQLEWKYTPKNFIEEQILIKVDGYELAIFEGIAFAKIDPVFFEENPKIREILTDVIENRLHSVQIVSHQKFSLSKPSRCDLGNDGKKHHYLEAACVGVSVTSDAVDFVIKDKDGNIVSDSKRDRLNKQKWFAKVLDEYRGSDTTLNQMLKSYNMAVKDPKNELIHLYEIRDAISVRFGNKRKAIKYLGVSNRDWNTIGDLANRHPLAEGRHRGKSAGDIRPADKNELKSVRTAISNLVEKYLIFLETA